LLRWRKAKRRVFRARAPARQRAASKNLDTKYMPTLVQVVTEKFRPYKTILLIIAAVIFFSGVSYYIYNRYAKPELIKTEKGYDDIANRPKNGASKQVEIMFFHANWCPHCKACAGDWENFYKNHNKEIVNGYEVVCKDVDCTNEDDAAVNALLSKYKVEGFPTVIGIADGKEIAFDAKVTQDNLEQFLTTLTK
jgi:thiol-disulfide isomerase/thioredoxin